MRMLLFVMLLIGSSVVQAQTLALKPGLYKVKSELLVNGKDPMAEARKQLANMPEAVRQQMMKTMPNFNGTREHCVKKEELTYEKFSKSLKESVDCEYKYTKKTPKEMQATAICKNGDKSKVSIKVLKPTHYVFSLDGTIQGHKKSKMKSEGIWISAKCGKKE